MAMPEGLARLLMGVESSEPQPELSHEVQIMRLREAALRYARPNPFKVGDLVTPCSDMYLKWKGMPHLVIDVNENASPVFNCDDAGDKSFGMKPDIRVILIDRDGDMLPFWNEQWQFEFYVPPKE